MKQKITMLILFIGLNTIAQIKFEKGYFISNNGIKTECLIKNEGWRNNPTEFKYKINIKDQIKTKTINNTNEFGVKNTFIYRRYTVKVDRSSIIPGKLSDTRLSVFKIETLFLKLLLDSKVSLYSYNDQSLRRFFTKKKNIIQQLEYKHYKASGGLLAKNKNYIKQLKDNFPCKKIKPQETAYLEKDLINYFNTYNNCSVEQTSNIKKTINYSNNSKKTKRLKLFTKLHIVNSSISINNDVYPPVSINFDSSFIFKAGMEIEYILPYNKNTWSIFFEPTYQSAFTKTKSAARTTHVTTIKNYTVDYKSIEILAGLRHYFFLNDNSSIFINSGLYYSNPLGSKVNIVSTININDSVDLEMSSPFNFLLGVGYSHKKYRVELRYNTSRELLDYIHWASNFDSVSVTVGYQLL